MIAGGYVSVRCNTCRTSGAEPHEPGSQECRDWAAERAWSINEDDR